MSDLDDLDDKWQQLRCNDPTVATAMQRYDLSIIDSLKLLVVTLVAQREAIQAELLRAIEQRGPSPITVAASAYADHRTMEQAAIAQAVSMPAAVIGDPQSAQQPAEFVDVEDIHQQWR